MWRWYARITFGIFALFGVAAATSAALGGDTWEMALAALWWTEYIAAVALLLALVSTVRFVLRRRRGTLTHS